MILDQFELKNMALRFENSAWTTECFDSFKAFALHLVDLCSDPSSLRICMFIFFLYFPFLSLTGVMLQLLLIICLAVACLLTET